MRFTIISVGKKPKAHEQSWIDEYAHRLKRHTKLDLIRVRPAETTDIEKSKSEEWKHIERHLETSTYSILLGESGKKLTSKALAEHLSKLDLQGRKDVTFVIGGSYGIPETSKKKFSFILSLGDLTLAHRVALLVLLEQLYRAFMIRSGHPYHHGD